MSIKLGGTWYDFQYGSLEKLGGREVLHIRSASSHGTTECFLATLVRCKSFSEARPVEAVGNPAWEKPIDSNDPNAFGPPIEVPKPEAAPKTRSPYSYLQDIIEGAMKLGDFSTALAAVKEMTNYPMD